MPVYETKKITKDGRKYYYSCYYKDKYGKNKKYMSKMYKGVRECERAERKFLEITEHRDIAIKNEEVTFELVCEEWLSFKESQVKETSFYCIEGRIRKYILDFFKDYNLYSIKIPIINEWKNWLHDSSLNKEGQNKIIGYAMEIFRYAVTYYDFDNKIVVRLQKNKVSTVEREKDSKWNFITYEEFQKLLSCIDDEFDKLIIYTLYFTGLRIGELMGLNWYDIDFERKTLRINKELTVKIKKSEKAKGIYYKLVPPKTSNSIRTIDLSDNLVEKLKKHYENEKAIYNFDKSMFVFGNVSYIKETTLRNHLKKYIELAQIKPKNPYYKKGDTILTLHGFRHSHASLLINLGLDSRDVAERLGDTIQMVESTYYHIFPQKKSNTVNALNKLNREP